MKITRTLGVVVGPAAVASLSLAGLAQTKPIEKGTFHDEFTESARTSAMFRVSRCRPTLWSTGVSC